MSAPGIVVENLSYRYPGASRPALQDVSFTLDGGETLLIVGPSGCGKSTLALCLNGLIPHNIEGDLSGRVLVGERDLQDQTVAETARQVGMVFQDPESQFCMLRADDEIAFGLENLKVPAAEMPRRITRALDAVGLAGHERARVDWLSGGAKQRLAIASIVALEPAVLVFDEPTSNLDPAGASEVFDQIAHLKASGERTIVLVEHRIDELLDLIDRVLVLGPSGAVLAYGRPERIFRDRAAELDQLGVWRPEDGREWTLNCGSGLSFRAAARNPGVSHEYVDRDSSACAPWNDNSLTGRTASLAPAIAISHLSYRYPRGPQALNDVTLDVPEGSVFAIVGPNGAGKSTLARSLIGLIRPPRGAIRLFGRDLRELSATDLANLIGYVFQNPEHQFVATTVYDEVAFGLRVRHLAESAVDKVVKPLLNQFGLAHLAKANPFALSYGEKRRLSVAAMLVLEPRVLVLDEPTFGQDRRNTEILLAKLGELNEQGTTIVIITHDLRLVARQASHVAVLEAGRLAFIGAPGGLFGEPVGVRAASW
jgi:energy-coupling factor transport system ATP-binding protein